MGITITHTSKCSTSEIALNRNHPRRRELPTILSVSKSSNYPRSLIALRYRIVLKRGGRLANSPPYFISNCNRKRLGSLIKKL